MISEELVETILARVLKELDVNNSKSCLMISDSNNLDKSKEEISFLHFDKTIKYNNVVIDYLSLQECARIIHGLRDKAKINFILDHYLELDMQVIKIEDEDSKLAKVYKEELIKKGFIFKDKIKQPPSCTNKIKLDKKVIGERDLINIKLNLNDTILIPNKSIITPLAKDYIRMKNINIVEEE
ncbi:MAG: hypothetical protein RR425_07105 [Erysipelotrichales bacterium]